MNALPALADALPCPVCARPAERDASHLQAQLSVQQRAAIILKAEVEADRLERWVNRAAGQAQFSFSAKELHEFAQLLAHTAAIAEQYHLAIAHRDSATLEALRR